MNIRDRITILETDIKRLDEKIRRGVYTPSAVQTITKLRDKYAEALKILKKTP